MKVAEMIFSGALQPGQYEFVKVAPQVKNGWAVEKANDQGRKEIRTVKFQTKEIRKKNKVIILAMAEVAQHGFVFRQSSKN